MELALPTAPELAFILSQRVAHLATVAASGEAFPLPVCFAYDGTRFVTPIDQKPKQPGRTLQRLRNIAETGRASLVFDRYDDDDWSRLGWVMVRGWAVIVSPEEPGHAEAVALLRERYRQYRVMELERLPVIALSPSRITSWGSLDLDGEQVVNWPVGS